MDHSVIWKSVKEIVPINLMFIFTDKMNKSYYLLDIY